MSGLSPNDLVNVTVSLSPTASAIRNFGSLLILGSSPVIDTNERRRLYASLAAVGSDFGQSAPEYLAASLFFGQSPQPAQVYIGRWARTASSGVLHGAALAAAAQLMTAWNSITTGSMSVTIDGTAKNLSALNFSTAANMNAVAAVVNTALGAAGTCVWNANYSRFDITSATTGTNSSVTYATATGSGVDVSAQLGLTQAAGASAPVAGIAAETAIAAVNVHLASSDWYGLTIADTNAVTSDHLAIAAVIEAAVPQRIYGVSTQDASTLNSTTTDIAAQLQAAGYNRSFVQYSSTSPYTAASIFGREFTINFSGSNTTNTLMYKTEPGVTAETLSEAQAANLKAKNCNVFVNYSNGTAIIQYGTMASGRYFDEVHGTDWWQNDMQSAVLNRLYTNPTKIPQTDAGNNQLLTDIIASCGRARTNGLIAAGVWNGPAIGSINTGDTLTDGFYAYAPPVASQTTADRAARKSVSFQVAGKLAGAIHTANVLINVSR